MIKQQTVYNLEDFATKYHLDDIFGAYAAHFSVTIDDGGDFIEMVEQRTLFTKLLLVKQGSCKILLNEKGAESIELISSELLIVPVKDTAKLQAISSDFEAECVLIDESFTTQATRYHLSIDKYKSIIDIFHFIRDIVRHQHINKIEMINGMFNVLRLIIEELPYETCILSHDLRHKKEVYEIFLHHLYRNFRKERQIRFYANKLNISSVYLSRLVKEISGTTVNDHVTTLVYKEICNLLKQSDMTMGEIADELSFSDQSAMTNFFKQRSGMTPLAYRNK